jgi:hypothetical protein
MKGETQEEKTQDFKTQEEKTEDRCAPRQKKRRAPRRTGLNIEHPTSKIEVS